ncbi:hypothetical protein ONZ45_g6034 [Pleurotus djamor]|nr:hypothetical protein ONZ45_g6034 [Pleurotus djamor]
MVDFSGFFGPSKPHPNRLSRLPRWVSHWLGYRAAPSRKLPDWQVWMWTWIAAFCGISVIQAVFTHAHYFVVRGAPTIVASYGASAVLIYGAIEAPLAQPRALLGGHFLGALTGVIITKLVHLLPTEERYIELQWLAGSLACATAIVVMQITKTTHPPAGATALLAAVDADVRALGWYYLPIILLSSTLALAIALLVNNIQRRYPVFWIEPSPPAPVMPPRVESMTETRSKDSVTTAKDETTVEVVAPKIPSSPV